MFDDFHHHLSETSLIPQWPAPGGWGSYQGFDLDGLERRIFADHGQRMVDCGIESALTEVRP